MSEVINKNNNIVVSVICLTYNHEKYIQQALDSMLMQKTNFLYEIIVHDDVSSDDTVKIIQKYAAKYPKIIIPIYQKVNQYSQGISINHKFTLPISRGKYIAYCEGDDYWTDPYKLQKQVDFLEGNPTYVATTHECWEIDENGYMLSSRYFYGYRRTGTYTIDTHQNKRLLYGQTATLMHRKEAFELNTDEEIEEFGKITATGDVKKVMLISLRGNTYCFDEVMSHHRRIFQSGDSWSAQLKRINVTKFVFDGCLSMTAFAKNIFGIKLNYKKHLSYYIMTQIVRTVFKPNEGNWKDLKEMIKNYPYKKTILFDVIYSALAHPFRSIKTRWTGMYHKKKYGDLK